MPKLRYLLAMALLVMAAAASTTAAQAAQKQTNRQAKAYVAAVRWLGGFIEQDQQETWSYQLLMGRPKTPTTGRNIYKMSISALKRARLRWRWHAANARKAAQKVPHLHEWLCIFSYENNKDSSRGSTGWATNTGTKYFGGLQMDWGFMRSYGGWLLNLKGTADNWTPTEQMWVAEHAYESGRGFNPWPNTARACGLI
jgi:hypothetical protein